MSQTPSSAKATYPTGRFDIGPGGTIADCPANHELLELIENTPPLSPVELYILAVSYQKVVSNSGLGNRLAFIALDSIFQNPIVQQLLSVSSQPLVDVSLATDNASCPWYCAFVPANPACSHCGPHPTRVVKRVPDAGLELLVEVTQVDETKTFAILGVSPSVLTIPDLPVQVRGSDPS
jgi:hypothetical protein